MGKFPLDHQHRLRRRKQCRRNLGHGHLSHLHMQFTFVFTTCLSLISIYTTSLTVIITNLIRWWFQLLLLFQIWFLAGTNQPISWHPVCKWQMIISLHLLLKTIRTSLLLADRVAMHLHCLFWGLFQLSSLCHNLVCRDLITSPFHGESHWIITLMIVCWLDKVMRKWQTPY